MFGIDGLRGARPQHHVGAPERFRIHQDVLLPHQHERRAVAISIDAQLEQHPVRLGNEGTGHEQRRRNQGEPAPAHALVSVAMAWVSEVFARSGHVTDTVAARSHEPAGSFMFRIPGAARQHIVCCHVALVEDMSAAIQQRDLEALRIEALGTGVAQAHREHAVFDGGRAQ